MSGRAVASGDGGAGPSPVGGVELEVRHGGRSVVIPLPHGSEPDPVLLAAGWRRTGLAGAVRVGPAVRLIIEAEPADGAVTAAACGMPPPRDAGLVVDDGEEPHPHQRVACYAVIADDDRLLLAQGAESLGSIGGAWFLPGGGLDPGEEPDAGVRREVWEETGHRLAEAGLAEVYTQHWVGRAPSGRLEDFHAVRLLYRATVTEVREPVVHDVGGSTSVARWVPRSELARLRRTAAVDRALELLGWSVG